MNQNHATAFVFATIQEAQPLVERLEAAPVSQASYPTFRASKPGTAARTFIFVCGMGGGLARAALDHLVEHHRIRRVINCGVAGSLTNRFAIGDIVGVEAVAGIQACDPPESAVWVRIANANFVPHTDHLRGARLLSQDKPLFDATRRSTLARIGDLVDMEGAAIAETCGKRHVKLSIIKSVSDHALDRSTLLKNLNYASTKLAEFILPRLPIITGEVH